MKTYWLLGKRTDEVEEAQSHVPFVGGGCSAVCGAQAGDHPCSLLAANVDIQLATEENEVLPAEYEVIVTETNEDSVAYYGHVPHDQSPRSTNNGHFKFGWEKVSLQRSHMSIF